MRCCISFKEIKRNFNNFSLNEFFGSFLYKINEMFWYKFERLSDMAIFTSTFRRRFIHSIQFSCSFYQIDSILKLAMHSIDSFRFEIITAFINCHLSRFNCIQFTVNPNFIWLWDQFRWALPKHALCFLFFFLLLLECQFIHSYTRTKIMISRLCLMWNVKRK